jgi:hypothetical protein
MHDLGEEPVLESFHEEVWRETFSDNDLQEEVNYIASFFIEWVGDFLHPFGDNLIRADKLDNSIYYSYLAAQSAIFEWLSVTLLCGNYEIVMRELRTILEVMFPAYFLDSAHPDIPLDGKLRLLQELEESRSGYGKKVFKMSEIDGWEYYYDLYRQLCQYTHLSMTVTGQKIKDVTRSGFNEWPNLRFDKQKFLNCVAIWKEVTSLALHLARNLVDKYDVKDPDYMQIYTDK